MEPKNVFVQLAGEIGLSLAIPEIMSKLSSSQDVDFMSDCLLALGDIGDSSATNILSDFLYSGRRQLVLAAIKGLSQIDTPTSVRRLFERMGTDSELDLLILDGFARLEDTLALEHLNMALQSQQAYIRNYTKEKLTKIGAKAIPLLTENLLRTDNIDLLVHSLNVLGFIGDLSAVRAIRKLLHNEPADANVRFAAYESLGMMPLAKGAYVLADGLVDPVDQVRIAAAKAIEWNCDDILIAGVQNLVTGGGKDAVLIIEAFLGSESHKMVLALYDTPHFKEVTFDFLSKQAHPDLLRQYQLFFKDNGHADFAMRLASGAAEKNEEGRLIFAVDDSRMILGIYKNTLFQLDMDVKLFEFPAMAVAEALQDKPDIIITDLNMPEVSGIDLARQLRKKYDKVALPIIMVTTQSDSPDHKEAYEAGVNKIINKPFTTEDIKIAIAQIKSLPKLIEDWIRESVSSTQRFESRNGNSNFNS